MPRLYDATLEYSRKLCKESVALRKTSGITVTESKKALARSRLTAATIRRRKARFE